MHDVDGARVYAINVSGRQRACLVSSGSSPCALHQQGKKPPPGWEKMWPGWRQVAESMGCHYAQPDRQAAPRGAGHEHSAAPAPACCLSQEQPPPVQAPVRAPVQARRARRVQRAQKTGQPQQAHPTRRARRADPGSRGRRAGASRGWAGASLHRRQRCGGSSTSWCGAAGRACSRVGSGKNRSGPAVRRRREWAAARAASSRDGIARRRQAPARPTTSTQLPPL